MVSNLLNFDSLPKNHLLFPVIFHKLPKQNRTEKFIFFIKFYCKNYKNMLLFFLFLKKYFLKKQC